MAGSSRYFRGGIVCYSDEAKVRILGVPRETMTSRTAVSGEVAAEMASRCRGLLETTWGLSATGYAGPEGGGESSPPGTVFLAASGPAATVGRRLILPGERELVRERAAQAALDLLRRLLLGGDEAGPAPAPR